MCSGSIIHSLNDEQDIRKIGGLFKALPLTTTALIIGVLALTGIPFLTGFYSKDLIIETANTSYTNAWALLTTLVATSITAAYSTRIVFFVLLGQPRFNPVIIVNENNPLLINSIKRLLLGSIFAGYLIFHNITPTTIPQTTIPYYLKIIALAVTILGFILALELNSTTQTLKLDYPQNPFKFSIQLGYFPIIIHRLLPIMSLSISQKMASILLDTTWLENVLPKSISYFQIKSSITVSNQKGLIKLYFLSFMITLILSFFVLNFHE